MSSPKSDRPDIESILAELRADQEVLLSAPPAEPETNDEDLHTLLAEANRLCQAQPCAGWKAVVRKPFRFLFADLFAVNIAMVRCLNRITLLLGGEDLPETGPLLDAQKRRLTLLQHLNERVAALEAKMNSGEPAP